MTHILFVCTGNICRSPSAEGVLRHKLKERGLDHLVWTDSAGTTAYHVGHFPDERTMAVALRRGYDLSGLRARQVVVEDFKKFDLILAMDQSHEIALHQMAANAAEKSRIGLFLSVANQMTGAEIPDPYYGDIADFEHVLDVIEHGVDGLLAHLGYT